MDASIRRRWIDSAGLSKQHPDSQSEFEKNGPIAAYRRFSIHALLRTNIYRHGNIKQYRIPHDEIQHELRRGNSSQVFETLTDVSE